MQQHAKNMKRNAQEMPKLPCRPLARPGCWAMHPRQNIRIGQKVGLWPMSHGQRPDLSVCWGWRKNPGRSNTRLCWCWRFSRSKGAHPNKPRPAKKNIQRKPPAMCKPCAKSAQSLRNPLTDVGRNANKALPANRKKTPKACPP